MSNELVDGVHIMRLKRSYTDEWVKENVARSYVDESHYDTVITEDTDAYDAATGKMLFRFRKGALPIETLKLGVESFKGSVSTVTTRGDAAGGNKKRIVNGVQSKFSGAEPVDSGNVGSLDAGGATRYCRLTAFGREHFDKYKEGFPFVNAIDKLYSELCPSHYKSQKAVADGTNRNFVIGDTSFTTVTVNRDFRTAVHKDGGDWMEGFGNLITYREGDWTRGYFCLPEYRVGIDNQNGDALFVDVHRWHGNDEMVGIEDEGNVRYSFVLYYRSNMIKCGTPQLELMKIQQQAGNYMRL